MDSPAALALLARAGEFIGQIFGTEPFIVEGMGAAPNGQWNDLGRTEVLELNGRRVSFSAVAEFPRSDAPAFTASQFGAFAGRRVIRSRDGAIFRIVGEVVVDDLTVRFPLDSTNK